MRGKNKHHKTQNGQIDSQQTMISFVSSIAEDIDGERAINITNEMLKTFQKSPKLIFYTLAILRRLFDTQDEPIDSLISACFILMERQLEEIRFSVDRDFDWAKKLVEDFQNEVANLANDDILHPFVIKNILDALFKAKLEHTRELLYAHEELVKRNVPEVGIPTQQEFLRVLNDFISQHEGDPFELSKGFSELIRYLPDDAKEFLIGTLVNSNLEGTKDATVLLTLCPEKLIRKQALQWLISNPKVLTPAALRRLIVIRNWIPEDERKILDRLTKETRKQGVECSQWPPGEIVEKIQSSQVDGVGAQGLMFVTRLGKKSRISSVMVKNRVGIADAWNTPLITPRDAASTLRQVPVLSDVSKHYINTVVCHYIQVGLNTGSPPEVGLLQIAELLGITDWIPQIADMQELLEEIIGDESEDGMNLKIIDEILKTSDIWGTVPVVSDSWFEESQDVVEFYNSRKVHGDQLTQKIIEKFCEPNRQFWAEKLAWTAFWYNEQPTRHGKKNPLAFNFAILSRELYAGRSMLKIPFMETIARRTISSIRSFL